MLQARWILATSLAIGTPALAQPEPPAAPVDQSATERPEDQAAIKAQIARFTQAFTAGDAQAAASIFAEDARIEDIEGNVVQGRPAIAAHYAEYLADAKGAKLTLTPESHRFVGADAAMANGRMVVAHPNGETEASRFQALFIRQGGHWLLGDVRDLPDTSGSPAEHLAELDWLVGEWMDESDEATVHTSCEWDENHAFLLRTFVIEVNGERTLSGSQRIGWDAAAGQIKSWAFEADGGHSVGYWSRSGNQWLTKTTAVLPDGRRASSTQVTTRTGPDTMTWSSIERTIGGEVVPDLPLIAVVRRPPPPK